ncbi:MAG: extensin family protein, partial [Bradyrhizobium sp.]|nr:extensin family protein [Bradyrhizobium sp.]
MVSAALAVFALSWLMAAAPAAARSREAGHLQAHAAPGPSRNEPAIATVPLPQPRPEAAPPRVRAGAGATDSAGAGGKAAAAKGEPGAARQAQEKAGNEAGTDAKSDVKSDANAGPRALQVPQPSACRLALTEEIAVAPSIPPIKGPGACGGDDLVRLEAVVLPDKRRVAVTPAAIMRCPMASAIASWVRSDVV